MELVAVAGVDVDDGGVGTAVVDDVEPVAVADADDMTKVAHFGAEQ